MKKNRMKEVANLLGVGFNKQFKIMNFYSKYKINECGLICLENYCIDNCTLRKLLTGEYEIEEQILDDVEKRYLENVLRPFKDNVNFIVKYKDIADYHYINVAIGGAGDNLTCPDFEKDTMYKGMEVNKRYNMKELGLFEEN